MPASQSGREPERMAGSNIAEASAHAAAADAVSTAAAACTTAQLASATNGAERTHLPGLGGKSLTGRRAAAVRRSIVQAVGLLLEAYQLRQPPAHSVTTASGERVAPASCLCPCHALCQCRHVFMLGQAQHVTRWTPSVLWRLVHLTCRARSACHGGSAAASG
jgi:hypothetical protein